MVPTPEQVAQFRAQGFFITEPLFSPAELDAVVADFDRLRAALDEKMEGQSSGITHKGTRYFIPKLHEQSEPCRRMVTGAPLVELAVALMGPEVRLYWNQAVIKPPKQGGSFAWHQDTGYVPMEPQEYLTCWLALDDSTLDNGCIWVIPGSHKWGLQPHDRDPELNDKVGYRGPEQGIAVPIKRGQVIAFSSLCLHRSGPNTSEGSRRAYVIQYCKMEAINPETGQPWGDLVPVARAGRVLAA
jgi:hypothetical protein